MPVSQPELDKSIQDKLKKYTIDLTNIVSESHVQEGTIVQVQYNSVN